ncbi:MAG TPA: DUF732 domain-containing protein [Mycobacterium sp.]|jgi:hypothetical protein|nr:DUF732 domain-containing protein [Mycobacterium sp.]
MRIVVPALVAGTAMSLAFAAPASADTAGYLAKLQDVYPTLSSQQLLTEGYKVCAVTRSGKSSADALQMVQKDIGVSVPAAGDIVSAAVVHLGC